MLIMLIGLKRVEKVGKVCKENKGLTLNTMIKLPLFWHGEKSLQYLENECNSMEKFKRWCLTGKSEL